MNKKPLITILIPTINEDTIIRKTISDCYKLSNLHVEILVIVDSKTTKKTLQEAKKTKARIIDVGKSNGKGSAIKLAIPYIKGAYTVQIDADYQFMPIEIPKLLVPVMGEFDVALGTRYQKGAAIEKGSVSLFKFIGSFGLSAITSIFTSQRITDVMAGFKAFKTPILRQLHPEVNNFGYEAELVIKAAKEHYKIVNIPITYKKRTEGRSNVASIKHGLLVLQTILSVGLFYRPLRK